MPLQGKLDELLTHLVMSFLGYGPSVAPACASGQADAGFGEG